MGSLFNMLTSRVLPALLTALGVVLITAGLLTYPDPTTAGTAAIPTPEIIELPSDAVEAPTGSPSPSVSLAPGVTPAPTPEATKRPSGREFATRVVVPALDIDLPVISGNDGYPYCNVAMYLTSNTRKSQPASTDAFGQPGEGRATYIYSHARDGMFGAIYELAIRDRTPNKMLGMVIQLYTSWNRLYLFEVRSVRLHITSLDKAMSRGKEEVWLQTSEGPKGTPGKTQVIGRFLSVEDSTKRAAQPKPKPVRC